MKCINEMKLKFLSRSQNESFARITVAAFISSFDPTLAEISEIKTIVSEAVTNAIVHGYKDIMGYVYITVRLYEKRRTVISISDSGVGIEDVKKAREPLFTSCDTGERAGMGFTIMENFSDKLKVYSQPGKGTKVIMEKTLLSRA